MRSRSKQGMSGTRFRAHNSGPLKGLMIVPYNRERQAFRRATQIRCRLEQEVLARRNAASRIEEPLALFLLAGVPSVADIAWDILRGGGRYV